MKKTQSKLRYAHPEAGDDMRASKVDMSESFLDLLHQTNDQRLAPQEERHLRSPRSALPASSRIDAHSVSAEIVDSRDIPTDQHQHQQHSAPQHRQVPNQISHETNIKWQGRMIKAFACADRSYPSKLPRQKLEQAIQRRNIGSHMPMAMLASLLDASMDGDMVSRLKFERAIKEHQYQPSVHAVAGDYGGPTAADENSQAPEPKPNPQDQQPPQRPLELLEADDLLDVCETERGEPEDVPPTTAQHDGSRSDARVDEWLHNNGLGMFADVFAHHMIEFDVLTDLHDADLRELNISAVGARKKILKAVAKLSAFKSQNNRKKKSNRKKITGEAPQDGTKSNRRLAAHRYVAEQRRKRGSDSGVRTKGPQRRHGRTRSAPPSRSGRASPPPQPARAITPDAQRLPAIAARSKLATRTRHIDVETVREPPFGLKLEETAEGMFVNGFAGDFLNSRSRGVRSGYRLTHLSGVAISSFDDLQRVLQQTTAPRVFHFVGQEQVSSIQVKPKQLDRAERPSEAEAAPEQPKGPTREQLLSECRLLKGHTVLKEAVAQIASMGKAKQSTAGPPTSKRRHTLTRRAFKTLFKRALGLSTSGSTEVSLKPADIDVAFASARSKGKTHLSFKEFMGACADICMRANISFQHLLTAVDETILKQKTPPTEGPRSNKNSNIAAKSRVHKARSYKNSQKVEAERSLKSPSPPAPTAARWNEAAPRDEETSHQTEVPHGGDEASGEGFAALLASFERMKSLELSHEELVAPTDTDMSQHELKGESVFQPLSEADAFAEAQMDASVRPNEMTQQWKVESTQAHVNQHQQQTSQHTTNHDNSNVQVTARDAAQFAREHVKRLTEKVIETHVIGMATQQKTDPS